MIEIHVNPARVERVVFSSMSPMEEGFDFAACVAIRPLVNRIDRRLKHLTKTVLQSESPRKPDRA
jgi:hypothetical protein